MIHVVAIITTRPGERETVLTAFREVVPSVHAEQGCIEYGPVIDADTDSSLQTELGPDTFMVIEKWDSLEALQAHAVAPHMSEYAAKIKDLLANRVIHVLSPT